MPAPPAVKTPFVEIGALLKVWLPVKVCAASVRAMVAVVVGNVIVVESVPVNVIVLLTVNTFAAARVSVPVPVVHVLPAKVPTWLVAVSEPVEGLNESLVLATFSGRLPEFAVTQTGNMVAFVVVSFVIVAVVAALAAAVPPPLTA